MAVKKLESLIIDGENIETKLIWKEVNKTTYKSGVYEISSSSNNSWTLCINVSDCFTDSTYIVDIFSLEAAFAIADILDITKKRKNYKM